ncbi:MAG TPA: hypothetical protein VKC66_07995 [Xanthobacteraceae bacterium]|nr:hypothetical protein [Xanthobacteraceae bacterium]
MRLDTTQRSRWAQLRIGACALLLPPLTLGVALFSMLAPPDDGAARPSGAADRAQAGRTELPRNTEQPSADGADPQALAPIMTANKPAPPEGHDLVAAARPKAVNKPDEVTGQALAPVRMRVTAEPPARPNPPPRASNAPAGTPGAELSQSAPVEAATALRPRALNPSGQAASQILSPRMLPAEMLAAQAPLVDLPSAEAPQARASAAAKPARASNPGHRSHPHGVRRYAQQRHQQEFSLKNWFQQHFGTRPNNSGG